MLFRSLYLHGPTRRLALFSCAIWGLILLVNSCGGGGTGISPPPPANFSLTVSPAALLVPEGSTSGTINVSVQGVNGFKGQVAVTLNGLPSQVTPSVTFPWSISAGNSQSVQLTVADAVARGNYSLSFAGTSGSLTGNANLALTVSGAAVAGPAQDFKKQVIYQIVTDRFLDGDPTNDDPPQSPGMNDSTKTNWQMYWGGDLAGIQQNMAYLAGLGVTAIWISPPVDNINQPAVLSGTSYAPYHGYWARDMQQIEEHFGDANNSWTAFDNLVTSAHQNGIRVIVDFAANDSNPDDAGENGNLYNKGAPFASYQNDPAPPNNLFHHNPTITNFNDPYQLQYYTLDDLADLNQENSQVDGYLKQALLQFMQHGADAFRLDAVKHVTWGWEFSLANTAFTAGPTFLFGEWLQATTDPTYPDSVTFSNRSGIGLLDYPLAYALQDAFGNDADFHEVDDTITQENSDFASPNDLVTFLDNHDIPRLLTLNNNQNRLQEALALLLACRGIPVVLYGDEQYLHNDTNGGNDPYNRVWMSAFNTGTTAYQLVTQMANLRQGNLALAYGTSQQRWINSDVYILERQFFNDVVLIAVNKNDSTPQPISGLYTALPPGSYPDYLNGVLGGFSMQVNSGGGNNPVTNFSLPPHTVSVWQSSTPASSPELGSVGPRIAQAGLTATAAGDGFGSSGTLLVGPTQATVQTWSNSSVTFTVPPVSPGPYNVTVMPSGGTASNALPLTVLTGPQIPVTFTVNTVPLASGASVYLTGNLFELGNGVQNASSAVGPLLAVPGTSSSFFINASLPAGAQIQFTFFQVLPDNSTVSENTNHSYTGPTSGVGNVSVTW
ncbi:MAG: alpha-amylase family glycosyl hydrolase [Candidatus Sulfotelmatobacter sp.]